MASVFAARERVSADPEGDGVYLCHCCGNDRAFIGIAQDDAQRATQLFFVDRFRMRRGRPAITYGFLAIVSNDGVLPNVARYTTIACQVCSALIYGDENE